MRFLRHIFGLSVWKAALYGLFLVLVIFGSFSYSHIAEATFPSHKIINASIDSYSCDDSEWHFVITRLDRDSLAPQSIQVSWENGADSVVFLDSVTGGTAHYRTTTNLDSLVAGAFANIYFKWAGQFNLSHGPCDKPPPPPPIFECNDQIDNDGDGDIDYPQDEGCENSDDDDENEPPVITLLGTNPITITFGGDFIDPGATADDPEDGDITSQIIVGGDAVSTSTTGTYIITYNVSDSDGVTADEKTRTVEVEDDKQPPPSTECNDQIDNDGDSLTDSEDPACHTDGDPENPNSYDPDIDDENEPPVITLLGTNPITITFGGDFIDPGATADDPEDGDITSQIIVGGDAVSTSTTGTYIITYNVSDSDGVTADEKTRTVEVEDEVIDNDPPDDDPPEDDDGGGGGGGGTPIALAIMNEDVQAIGANVVRVTWQTNLHATSRVVYDTLSHPIISDPLIDYSTTSTHFYELVTDHGVVISGLLTNTPYYFRPISERSNSRVVGKELLITLGEDGSIAIIPETEPFVCDEYLKEYIKFGEDNDPTEVSKLQLFLRDFEGFSEVSVNGVYDQVSFNAVSEFQERYRTEILDPWGLDSSTGYVYYTTRKKINEIYCDREFPLTENQLAEIEEFRLFIETVPPGSPPIDTGSVGFEEGPADSFVGLAEGQEENQDSFLAASIGENNENTNIESGGVLNNLAAALISFSERQLSWIWAIILILAVIAVWLVVSWLRRRNNPAQTISSPTIQSS